MRRGRCCNGRGGRFRGTCRASGSSFPRSPIVTIRIRRRFDNCVNEAPQGVGISQFQRNLRADPCSGQASNLWFFDRAIIPTQVIGILDPLDFLLLLHVGRFWEGGAEHGGKADGAGIESAEDEGMSSILQICVRYWNLRMANAAYSWCLDLKSSNLV